MTYKTNKKDFLEFKKEAEYWLEYFGLSDWEVRYSSKELEVSRGDCSVNIIGKTCNIRLSSKWEYEPARNEVKKCAFHEVCELLLCQLGVLATWGHSNDIVTEQLHYVIRTLENTIFKEHRP